MAVDKKISYRINKINLIKFLFTDENFTDLSNSNFTIGFRFDVKEPYINVDVSIEVTLHDTYVSLIETRTHFEIINFNSFVEEGNINDNFLIQLLSISLSSSRGYLVAKTEGISNKSLTLPIVNPQKIFENKRGSLEYFLQRSAIYQGVKNFEKAIEELNKVLEIDTNNPVATINKLLCLIKSSRPKEAESVAKDYLERVGKENKEYYVYYLLALAYTNQKKYEDAIDLSYKVIKETNGEFLEIYLPLVSSLIYKKKNEEAFEQCEKYLEKHSNKKVTNELAPMYINYGEAARALKKYDIAISSTLKAIEINSNIPASFATLSQIYAELALKDLHFKYLEEALKRGYDLAKSEKDDPILTYKDEKVFQDLVKKFSD
jgi:tetratricopeptide (TPR) repeat protein